MGRELTIATGQFPGGGDIEKDAAFPTRPAPGVHGRRRGFCITDGCRHEKAAGTLDSPTENG